MNIKVILQEKLANLGNVGDQVNVKPGFARNYLIPFGKAVIASKENIAEFEKRRAELEKKAAFILAEAKKRAQELENLTVDITCEASEEGKLYGSVGPRDIAEAVTKKGIALAKSEVHLPQGLIRQVGEYDIAVQLHGEVETTIKVKVG